MRKKILGANIENSMMKLLPPKTKNLKIGDLPGKARFRNIPKKLKNSRDSFKANMKKKSNKYRNNLKLNSESIESHQQL